MWWHLSLSAPSPIPPAVCGCGGRQVFPDFINNIDSVLLNGGISMVTFFFVTKITCFEGETKKG